MTCLSEMKDVSIVAMSTGSSTPTPWKCRILVRSKMTTARVVAQFPGELAVAHIDGVDLPGPLLQQAVRETSRRGAHVEGRKPVDPDAKGVQGPLELHAAAAHVGVILAPDPDSRTLGNEGSRLVDGLLVDKHRARQDKGPRPLPGRNKAPVHEQHVQPDFGGFFFHKWLMAGYQPGNRMTQRHPRA